MSDGTNVRSVYGCVCKYSYRVLVFLVYHGLNSNLIYPANLMGYFDLIQILLQPLYITETLTHISAI